MPRLLAVSLFAFALALPLAAQPRVVGYYPSWARAAYPHTAIRYSLVTHLAHAFVWPTADGALLTEGHWRAYPEMVEAAHAAGVRVVVAVGGWSEALTPGFAAMAARPASRAAFVENLVAFVEAHGYDGVDLDWEYPRAADRAAFSALVRELKTALRAARADYTLSIALPSSTWAGGYDVPALQPHVDWFGLMTYDYHGTWTPHAGHNAPLYVPAGEADGSASASVAAWLAAGLDKSKALLGLPFYGYRFDASGLYQPRTGAVPSVTYWEAEALRASGWTYTWDATARVPFLQNPARTQLVTYDDTLSIHAKLDYVEQQGLGGAIVWAVHHDYDAGRPDRGQPLLEAVGARLHPASTGASDAAPAGGTRLGQNTPQPFRHHTRVPFDVARPGPVTIRVFDALGRPVAVVADGYYAAGRHEAVWDAAALPPGLYLCRLDAGGEGFTRPLLLVR